MGVRPRAANGDTAQRPAHAGGDPRFVVGSPVHRAVAPVDDISVAGARAVAFDERDASWMTPDIAAIAREVAGMIALVE